MHCAYQQKCLRFWSFPEVGQKLSHRYLCDFHRHQFEIFLETVDRASKKSNTTLNDQTRLELVLNHFEPISQSNTWEKTLLEASYTLPALDYKINTFVKMVDIKRKQFEYLVSQNLIFLPYNLLNPSLKFP